VAIRWVASPVEGVGTGKDPYRPVCGRYGDYLAVLDEVKGWAFCVLRSADFGPALADASLIVLPVLPMGDALTAAQATWLRNQLASHGLPSAWVTAGDTVRSTIRQMVRWVEPAFEPGWFRSVGGEDVAS
jgi:hypothetical protein